MSISGPGNPPPSPHARIVAEWVGIAQEDLDTASREHAYQGSRNLRAIGFHAQQAIEKLMKAVLIDRGVSPPKTHDLEVLAALLQTAGTPLHANSMDLARLTTSAVSTRYPGPNLSPSDVDELLVIARRIWAELRPLV